MNIASLQQLLQGATGPQPPGAAPMFLPTPEQAEDQRVRELTDILFRPPQVTEQTPPPEVRPWQRGVAGIADALGAYAAGLSGNNALNPRATEGLRRQREQRDATLDENARRKTEATDQVSRSKAEYELEDIKRRKAEDRIRTDRKQDRLENREWTKEQFDLEAKLRAAERAEERTDRAAEKAADRADRTADREDSQRFQERMGSLEAGWRKSLTEFELKNRETPGMRERIEGQRELLAATRGVALDTKRSLADVLKAKTPAQIREEFQDDVDAAGLEGEYRDAALAFWDSKVEPVLRQTEEAAKTDKGKRDAKAAERRRKIEKATRQVLGTRPLG